MDNPHYLTPQEALNKFCPQSMNSETLHWCCGPKCMAWRWQSLGHFIQDEDKKVKERHSNTHGYCGMVKS